jgi:hypothetical protein
MRRGIASSLKVNQKIPTNDKAIEFLRRIPDRLVQPLQLVTTTKPIREIQIMTHNAYTRQLIADLKLSELKAIAAEIGAEPADKRSKESFIVAIVDHQPQPIEEPAAEIEEPAAETDYPAECLKLAGVRTFHELKAWCSSKRIHQGLEFHHLYANALNYFLGFDSAYESNGRGCLDRIIADNAELSEAICEELQIEVVDLSVLSDDYEIPCGADAYYGYYNGEKIASVHTWGEKFIGSKFANLVMATDQTEINAGFGDHFSAILETIEPIEVERAKNIVLRIREIKTMELTDAEKSILIEFRRFNWVANTIHDLNIQKLVDKGLIAGYEKWFGLTDDGSKYLETLLIPDYM